MRHSIVVLLLDRDGQGSPIGEAVGRAGHRVVTATGVATAEIVLGSLLPDVVLVRATSPEIDRAVAARLEAIAPDIPVRVIHLDRGDDPVDAVIEAIPPAN